MKSKRKLHEVDPLPHAASQNNEGDSKRKAAGKKAKHALGVSSPVAIGNQSSGKQSLPGKDAQQGNAAARSSGAAHSSAAAPQQAAASDAARLKAVKLIAKLNVVRGKDAVKEAKIEEKLARVLAKLNKLTGSSSQAPEGIRAGQAPAAGARDIELKLKGPQTLTDRPQQAGSHAASDAPAGSSRRASAQFQWQCKPPSPAAASSPAVPTVQELAMRRLRQQRFQEHLAKLQQDQDGARQRGAASDPDDCRGLLLQGGYGTNASTEKPYFRLAGLPVAAEVRPPRVLRRALHQVQAKWLDGTPYSYVCDQLKSIRQDLTVQHVKGELAVLTYETHARIAIEVADFAEFKQCQSVLQQLYAGLRSEEESPPGRASSGAASTCSSGSTGSAGSSSGPSTSGAGNEAEFCAYLMLDAVRHSSKPMALHRALSCLPARVLGHQFVRHALKVCAAFKSANIHAFLQLYLPAPRMTPYLMDPLLDQLRPAALRRILVAHNPLPVPLDWLVAHLGCSSAEQVAEVAGEVGAVLDIRRAILDTRASRAAPAGPPRPAAEGSRQG